MLRFTAHLLLIALLGSAASAADGPVANLQRVTEQIWCGAAPQDANDFAAIAKLGVRVVVSVDGEKPSVKTAQKHNLRYVHVPIGYDGVPRSSQLTLVRLMRETQGPFYFHCHHGKHRGPTMAALAGLTSGMLNEQQALSVLRKSGTSTDYTGLWKSVRNWKPATQQEQLPPLLEVAETSSLVDHMVAANKSHRSLKALFEGEASSSKLSKQREMAALLYESLFESSRLPKVRDNRALSTQFRLAIDSAEALRAQLRHQPPVRTTATFQTLSQSCTACHTEFR